MAYPSNPWRDKLLPAYFRNQRMGGEEAMFHVESASKESGRRIVTHEFPKKDLPYAEDMGRRAMEFSVRAYCIAYPYIPEKHNNQPTGSDLYNMDYTLARDELMRQLDAEGPGVLQLPNGHGVLEPIRVVCTRYRMTEEQRLGGYCTFDISFTELGAAPFRETQNPREEVLSRSQQLKDAIARQLDPQNLFPVAARPQQRSWMPTDMVFNSERGRWEYGPAPDPTITDMPAEVGSQTWVPGTNGPNYLVPWNQD